MINFDDYTNESKIEHNLKWPYIPDHPCRILFIGSSGSRKTNALLNLINNQPDIDKICLYTKDLFESEYQYLINRREKVGVDFFTDSTGLLWNIQMICKMFAKILKIIIQERNVKY